MQLFLRNCLGALDGKHVKVRIRENEKVRYRNRKGDILTNVLGVCSKDMQFIYIYNRVGNDHLMIIECFEMLFQEETL